ncbi:MAG: DUF4435 domain-containing protein [Prevotella sp.]|nr:DUF4435 domain-containing protein [Prevotella sp.]
MAKRLAGNISSQYLEAANRLRSKNARKKIVAYVESYDDILFWRTVLSAYENEKRYFEVMLPSHKTLERGKKSVLMNLVFKGKKEERGETREERDMLGPSMIACVDADYDYLIKGATETSRKVCENPFVLHTYAYSIENLQCYAPSLHNVVVMVTLNDHRIFDFEEWLSLYSEAIFPLFVWSVWHYRRPIYGNFTITDFNRTIELGGFTLANPMGSIQNIRNKVFKKVGWLQRQYPDAKESYLALKRELQEELGVTPQTTYLYIQGHHLFDKVVVPVMQKVCTKLVRDREQEIRHQSRHSTQMRNELSCYSHSTQDIAQMLKKNMGYIQCDAFRRILRDTERLLNVSFEKPDGPADAEGISSGGDE